MAKEQVKFYVTEDEKRRLDTLANLRFMSVPNYVKMIALGVRIQQVKEIYIEQQNLENELLSDENKAIFEELLSRASKTNDKTYIRVDLEFNDRLVKAVQDVLNNASR